MHSSSSYAAKRLNKWSLHRNPFEIGVNSYTRHAVRARSKGGEMQEGRRGETSSEFTRCAREAESRAVGERAQRAPSTLA